MDYTLDSKQKCDICGTVNSIKFYHEAEDLWLCPSCSQQIYSCRGCSHREKCDVELNPLGFEPVVQKTVRRGQQVISMQIPNPQLYEHYCHKCLCSITNENDTYCARGCCGRCDNWELHPEYKKKEE